MLDFLYLHLLLVFVHKQCEWTWQMETSLQAHFGSPANGGEAEELEERRSEQERGTQGWREAAAVTAGVGLPVSAPGATVPCPWQRSGAVLLVHFLCT